MGKTVLLAWELGSDLGHVMRLRRIAARLQRHGLTIVAALKDVSTARWLNGLDVEVLQAPIWPGSFMSDAEQARLSSATYADTLAANGLADERALRALLAAWDSLFALLGPDLAVAEFAPAATLAARGRLPLALVGTGFSVPPAEMERFPPLHQGAPPVWPEAELLDIVNRALRQVAAPPLERLPQMSAADARTVATYPLLDPYREERTEPADGPFLDDAPRARREDAETILAYLNSRLNARPEVLEALRPLAPRLRVFAPGMSAADRDSLARAGARVETRPMPLAEALAESRLVVHAGGNGVAAQALATGAPQLVLSLDIEKDLTGAALERAGVGTLVKLYDPAAQVSSAAVAAMASDADLAARAADLGRWHRQAFPRDSLSTFESACLRLVAA